MIDILTGAAQEVLLSVALTLLSLGSAYAIHYVNKAKKNLQERTDAELVDRSIARAATFAESTVLAIEGRTAKALRQAVKGGTRSRRELLALGNDAVEDILKHMGDEGKKSLELSVGDASEFVRDLVDAEVERLKARVVPEALAKNSQGSEAS